MTTQLQIDSKWKFPQLTKALSPSKSHLTPLWSTASRRPGNDCVIRQHPLPIKRQLSWDQQPNFSLSRKDSSHFELYKTLHSRRSSLPAAHAVKRRVLLSSTGACKWIIRSSSGRCLIVRAARQRRHSVAAHTAMCTRNFSARKRRALCTPVPRALAPVKP